MLITCICLTFHYAYLITWSIQMIISIETSICISSNSYPRLYVKPVNGMIIKQVKMIRGDPISKVYKLQVKIRSSNLTNFFISMVVHC